VALVGATINAAAFGGWVLSRLTASRSSTDSTAPNPRGSMMSAAAVFAGVRRDRRGARSHWCGSTLRGVQRGGVRRGRGSDSRCHDVRRHRRRTRAEANDSAATAARPVPASVQECACSTRRREPKPYDPTKPIDLGGVPVSPPEQQARAENLVGSRCSGFPQWSDPKTAEAADSSRSATRTGDEHFVNLPWFDDGRVLDPTTPSRS